MERAFEQWKSKEVARLLALVETERRYYQELVANLPVSVAVLNTDCTLVAANRAFRQTFGVASDDMRRRRIDHILPSDELLARVQSVFESGIGSRPFVAERTVPGSSAPQRLRVSVQAIRDWDEDAGPQALLLVENVEDVAEAAPVLLAAAASAGAQSSGAMPAPSTTAMVPLSLPEPLPCVIWVARATDRKFKMVSPSSAMLLGIEPQDWINSPSSFIDRIHPEDRARTVAFFDQSLTSSGLHSAEFRMNKNSTNGRSNWYRETILVDPDRDSITGVITDVTARRAIEEQMLQTQRLDAIGALAGRIAHDINNPLMIVNGYAEVLSQAFPPNDPRTTDMREIQNAGKRIGDLTGYLQSATRKQAADTSPVDVTAELLKVVDRMRAAAGEYLRADYSPGTQSLSVMAEAGQLEAVLLELAAALVEGGGESAHLILSASLAQVTELVRPDQPLAPGYYVELSIVNESHSAPNLPNRLFESLLPGKETNREAGPALAKTFKTVQEWGGTIHTVTGKNEFRVYLKAAAIPKPPASPFSGPAEPAPSTPPITSVTPEPPKSVAQEAPVRKTSILIVEDEPGIRALMRRILQREGFDVLEAGGGAEALELLKQKGPVDLLITDVLMPGMTGRELATRVQITDKNVGILYVSGFTADTGVEGGQFPPGSHFLQKPFTLGSLVRKANEVLAASPRRSGS